MGGLNDVLYFRTACVNYLDKCKTESSRSYHKILSFK